MSEIAALPMEPVAVRKRSFRTAVARNRVASGAAIILLIIVMLAVLAPWLGLGDPVKMNTPERLLPPGEGGLMGSDKFGRDIFARILFGTRISLLVGVVSVLVAAAVGTAWHSLADRTPGLTVRESISRTMSGPGAREFTSEHSR